MLSSLRAKKFRSYVSRRTDQWTAVLYSSLIGTTILLFGKRSESHSNGGISKIHQHKEPLMNKDQVKGAAKDIAGKFQEQAGKMVDSKSQQAKGQVRQAEGKIQEHVGDVKERIKDIKHH